MSDFLRLVGERLRMIRKVKGLTQDQVAEKTGKVGMSKSHISDIERGQRNIFIDHVRNANECVRNRPQRAV